MKRYLLLFVAVSFFFPSGVFAAMRKDTIILIDSLSPVGYHLDKGWKFHTGDDPAFARADYDDHNWQIINAALKRPALPRAAQQGMGWLRIHLKIAPSLRQKALLQVQSIAAIEIYLDGKLIARRGTIYPRLNTGRGYTTTDPVTLQLTNDSVHIIAIRFANQADIQFMNWNHLDLFVEAWLGDVQTVITRGESFENFHFLLGICMSVLTLLALIHFVLFYYNRDKKANLYFALYAFFAAINLFLVFYCSYASLYYDTIAYLTLISGAVLLASGVWFVKALYTLFNFKSGRFYTWLIIVSVGGFLIDGFIEAFNGSPFFVVFALLGAVQLWLALKAVYFKKRGALIVAIGLLIGLAGIIVVACLIISENVATYWGWMLFRIALGAAVLSPASGISLFLSREFALDGRLLKLKLEQVEELSAQTIAQEQEKQEILASQNEQLEKQVTERTAELHQSLTNLKATQTQLIQSEKMASLGELTAGIAHEIQNPLNFVNNFSEVNTEMIVELEDELKSGNIEEALTIAADIKQNEQKITHHGKRADAIVKGMLQHSQSGSGTKEPTNINALADECMRLAYHGLRAKDKSFNSEMITHFDETLPKINVIPQDIVRVMLNLFNNAFYAVNQKQKKAGEDYKPEVSVSTSIENGHVIIKVKDNGIGIPDAIKEKIMQPFFTTKPTGEGTGLGLSLTYDMVVKGHSGSIKVDSVEGEGSEFTITLPVG